MPGTLVIGCGGPGRDAVSRLSSEGCRCLTMDWVNADLCLLPAGIREGDVKSDPDLASKLLASHHNEILLNMKGFTEIVLLTNLGGTLGSVCVPEISRCARENGSRFIIVLTVPFAFEETRREAAMSLLPSVSGYADRTFVMDLQFSRVSSMVVSEAIQAVDELFCVVAELLSDLIGSIPFMSTFTDPMYSFSRGSGDTQIASLNECIRNPLFNLSGVTSWKLVICADSKVTDTDRENMDSIVTGMNGALPQIIEGEGTGNGLTVFIPIFLRT